MTSASQPVLGIDIGGSGIKGAPVDLATGTLSADRLRIPTPKKSTPKACADVVAQIVEKFADLNEDGKITGAGGGGFLLIFAEPERQEDISRELTAHRPDVIAGDSMAFWAKLAAKKHGIPFVSSTTTFAFNRYSAKVMKQNGGQMLKMMLAMPKINRDLQRLRDRGFADHEVLSSLLSELDVEEATLLSREHREREVRAALHLRQGETRSAA